MELQEKGVSGSDIQAALDETEFPDEAEQILRWKEKKHFDPEAADAREKQRFFAFLQRRGYSSEAIRRVMQGLD
jgi:regulatory protein